MNLFFFLYSSHAIHFKYSYRNMNYFAKQMLTFLCSVHDRIIPYHSNWTSLENTVLELLRLYYPASPLMRFASEWHKKNPFPRFPFQLKTDIPIQTISISSVEVDLLTLLLLTRILPVVFCSLVNFLSLTFF